jgi:hypothetical protein
MSRLSPSQKRQTTHRYIARSSECVAVPHHAIPIGNSFPSLWPSLSVRRDLFRV